MACERIFIKMHSIRNKCYRTGRYSFQAHLCIIQPWNFTGWGSEWVKGKHGLPHMNNKHKMYMYKQIHCFRVRNNKQAKLIPGAQRCLLSVISHLIIIIRSHMSIRACVKEDQLVLCTHQGHTTTSATFLRVFPIIIINSLVCWFGTRALSQAQFQTAIPDPSVLPLCGGTLWNCESCTSKTDVQKLIMGHAVLCPTVCLSDVVNNVWQKYSTTFFYSLLVEGKTTWLHPHWLIVNAKIWNNNDHWCSQTRSQQGS